MRNILFGLALCFVATVLAEEFVGQITNPSQLLLEQETQRRLGDIMIGLQQAHGFNVMATAKMYASYSSNGESNYPSFLELKSQEEFFPFAGYGGGYGYGYPQHHQAHHDGSVADRVHFQKKSTKGKISALKYFFLQLTSTQSDVQMGYWMNKAMSTVLPQQIAVFKTYKNYLSTYAVSSAIQLHDSFTLEAYLEDFNQNFGFAGKSAQYSEAVAELNVYQQWQTLVMMRLYLFYISMYETSMAQQAAPVAPAAAPVPPTSFLEEELSADPSKPQDAQSAMLMQYTYMYYYVRMLKFYTLFMEMSIPQYGLTMASYKTHGYKLLTDGDSSNDADAQKWVDHAEKLDSFAIPRVIAQWSSMVQMRYYMEYYLMMFDMYLPAMATQRIMARIDSAMLNTNLLQQGKAEVSQSAQ